MNTVEATYQITLSDFRKATYYGLSLRHQRSLGIMFLVLLISLFYTIAAFLGLWKLYMLIPFVAVAYLIWGLILFAGAERGIKNYLKNPNCIIGKNHKTTLDAKHVHIQIPECKVNTSYPISKLACVFELSTLFLIYISIQDLYILPKRALEDGESDFLRENFRTQLGTRFYTRYDSK